MKTDQRATILAELEKAGPIGRTSEELTRICLRYSARIWELRHGMGYNIETVPRVGKDTARFILHPAVKPCQAELFPAQFLPGGAL